ncbi:MAG TPA: LamG domain-containing protein [Verrucomicrobiae bacterium]|jgi:hypothetical protein|nr:LamG domain-containing protein [Verrucomicrobiae bacterium]
MKNLPCTTRAFDAVHRPPNETSPTDSFKGALGRWTRGILCVIAFLFAASTAHAGLSFELHFYRTDEGRTYSFYTPLYTNSLSPAAPLGTYIISSPHQPTNGSVRAFVLSESGISDTDGDSENFYGDFNSAIYQITNGNWTLLFTNATTTNVFRFAISAPTMSSNMLPATILDFPVIGTSILTNDTNFSWQGPVTWPATGVGEIYNNSDYFSASDLSAAQTNWNVDPPFSPGPNYNFFLRYLYTNSTLFTVTTPTNTNSSQPFSGWDSEAVLETGFNEPFNVVASHGTPSRGHTLLADYTFEDNSPYVHDFSGNNNNTSYAWYIDGMPPTIVTNDAAAGMYAGGLGGSGWFTPSPALSNLFAGSFSISAWVKTTNVFGSDTSDQYSSAGIVSALGGDYDNSVAPMMQSGHKLGFYTGGLGQNVLYSHADITTGQYVHVVTTRDQQTGEKKIYINGVLDASVFASTGLLSGSDPNGFSIGYNNGNVFSGQVDEVQLYSGVLSGNEVALLHSYPGTNAPDILQLNVPVARYDFEDTNNPVTDSSGHNNNGYYSDSSDSTNDVASTNSAVGTYAREFFGNTYIYFVGFPMLSNALSGNFSVTAWVKTTNSVNEDVDNAYWGNPVLFTFGNGTNGAIPLSITGSKAAFTISNPDGNDTTIHSVTSVNDGRYHFIAVTRNQTSGVMRLYVDGFLEASATANTAPIQTPDAIFLGGGAMDYTGLMDDVRIYADALTADDVTTLAANGGTTFSIALGTTNIVWSTNGDTGWFVETTNTYNGTAAAAQSGSVIDPQTSTLSATVTGPGNLSFVWQNPTFGNLDLEFDIDGQYQNDIGSYTDWTQDGPYRIGPGQHTITWTVFPNGDTDPSESAFLGQVTFVSTYLVAHYDFDDLNANYPLDVSHNGNDMDYAYGYNGGGFDMTNDVAAGPGALNFFENPDFSFSGGLLGWNNTPAGLLSTLAGTFSISLWIKTTNHTANVGDIASDGACIIAGDVSGDANDLTPVALTGGAVAFGTGGTPGDDTLTSAKLVNDGQWHHIVVTRDQLTGQKRIYIDGAEDTASPGMGSTAFLSDPQLLSFCTRLNAASANPATPGPANSYDGLLDDVQIYSRVLTGSDVAFLYAHPGLEVVATTQEPVPVDVEIRLEFHRARDYGGSGVEFFLFPEIVSMSPAPTTYAGVYSPHGNFYGTYGTNASSGSGVYTSLDQILQECNSTNWRLVINGGSPNERDLRFAVTVTGLDTNTLPLVSIYSPTNGSVNVATNPVFYWSGPANYGGMDVVASLPNLQNYSAFLPVTATNWLSGPKLDYGTNQFGVTYTNSFPTVTISIPTDPLTSQQVSNWVASAALYTSANSTFVVGASGPAPVQLVPFHQTVGNFQFSFVTLAGRPHTVQARTNLTAGAWVDVTNFIGDGGLWQFTFPRTNSLPRFFRVQTQ